MVGDGKNSSSEHTPSIQNLYILIYYNILSGKGSSSKNDIEHINLLPALITSRWADGVPNLYGESRVMFLLLAQNFYILYLYNKNMVIL